MIISFFSIFALQCWSNSGTKKQKIFSHIASLLILVSGMGLLARLGIRHMEPWPLWAKVKASLWVFLAFGGPVVLKKLPQFKKQWIYIMWLTFIVISYFAIYKPI